MVLSPASLDTNNDQRTRPGMAGPPRSEWEPTTLLEGVGENDVLGVEAQLGPRPSTPSRPPESSEGRPSGTTTAEPV